MQTAITTHRAPEAIVARVLALSLLDEIEAGMMRGVPTRKAIEAALDRHDAVWRDIHPPMAIREAQGLLRGMGAADLLTTRAKASLMTPEVQKHLVEEARRARRRPSFWSDWFS
jgi:hypothetical protein